MKPTHRTNRVLRTLVAGLLLIAIQSNAEAQSLPQAARDAGVEFGSLVSDSVVGDPAYDQMMIEQTDLVTMTAYWKWSTHGNSRYEISFANSERVAQFAERHGKRIHGHPLLWASDQFIPDWVFDYDPVTEGRRIMEEHIDAVAGHYRGRVAIWDVVNEAIDDQGGYRDNYWRRAMGDQFLNIAFSRARRAAPSATLLYNDYWTETNTAKFNTLMQIMTRLKREGVPIDGVGWQMHVDADGVLASSFPLLERMNAVAALGLQNFITELDIRIPSPTASNLEKQKQAYKKIASIFLRVNNRGSLQTWDLSDKHTWLTDFLGSKQWPLPFDDNYQKKPAYFGLIEAFDEASDSPDAIEPGVYRLQTLKAGLYLHQSNDRNGAMVQGFALNEQWWSQLWAIEPAGNDQYRLRCLWGDNYLGIPTSRTGDVVRVYPFDASNRRLLFHIEKTPDGYYQLQNVGTGSYVKIADTTEQVPMIGFPKRPWKSLKWSLHFVRDN